MRMLDDNNLANNNSNGMRMLDNNNSANNNNPMNDENMLNNNFDKQRQHK